MKICFEELEEGEFFEYRHGAGDDDHYLYQKLIPSEHYNAVLLNNGQLCNIHPKTPLFGRVSLEITVNRSADVEKNKATKH
jgi:hypothetical protein